MVPLILQLRELSGNRVNGNRNDAENSGDTKPYLEPPRNVWRQRTESPIFECLMRSRVRDVEVIP